MSTWWRQSRDSFGKTIPQRLTFDILLLEEAIAARNIERDKEWISCPTVRVIKKGDLSDYTWAVCGGKRYYLIQRRAHKMPEQIDFGTALKELKAGKRVVRLGWNGKGMWLEMQRPDANSKMTLPYIYIEYPVGHVAYPDGCRVPWLASQTDLLAEDWILV